MFDLSTPDRIRTCDPQLRRLLLYPAELPGHVIKSGIKFKIVYWSVIYRNRKFIILIIIYLR